MIVNSFQMPNELVDTHLATIPDLSLKCYLFIVRKTIGWHKASDQIPLTQFEIATGKKKRALITALAWLEENDLVMSTKNHREVTEYSVIRTESLGASGCTNVVEMHPRKRALGASSCNSGCTEMHPSKDTTQNTVKLKNIESIKEGGCKAQGCPQGPTAGDYCSYHAEINPELYGMVTSNLLRHYASVRIVDSISALTAAQILDPVVFGLPDELKNFITKHRRDDEKPQAFVQRLQLKIRETIL